MSLHPSTVGSLHHNVFNWVICDKFIWHLKPPFVVESVTHDLELIQL